MNYLDSCDAYVVSEVAIQAINLKFRMLILYTEG